MRTKSTATFVKEIKGELNKNKSYIFYPLSDDYLYKLSRTDTGKYKTMIDDIISTLRNDKKVFKLDFKTDDVQVGGDWRNTRRLVYLISVVGKPCKEFERLNAWLGKYATRKLGPLEVRENAISGKRSSYSVDETYYLMHSPEKCLELLENLRKSRTTKDTISLKSERDIYWGDRYNSYGEDMECEWNGTETFYTDFIVKTPTGREKNVISAYF